MSGDYAQARMSQIRKNWGGENVWDVYCKSEEMSLDGVTKYSEW